MQTPNQAAVCTPISDRLSNRVAIVSGGSSGIGLATCRRLAAEGARVVIADINETAGVKVAGELGDAVAAFHALDVTRQENWRDVMDVAQRKYGGLDILVNCAGIRRPNTVESATLEEWHATLAVNLDGTFFGCQAAVGAMKERGGAIVNLSSISGLAGNADLIAYDASKGAVRALTKEVAAYCAARGYAIRCNSIHPGAIDTPQVSRFFDGQSDEPSSWVASHAIKRFGTADEVAAMIAFVASDDSSFSTGAEFVIDGGHMAGDTLGWE